MGIIKNTKIKDMAAAAEEAWASGRRYFTPFLHMPAPKGNNTGPVPDWSELIDVIEGAGWQLHTWAVAADATGRPNALPLFMRP